MPLVRQRTQRLRQEHHGREAHTQLALLGDDDFTGCPDPVPRIERKESLEALLAQDRLADEQLDPARHVLEHTKREASHVPNVHQPACDGGLGSGLGPRIEIRVLCLEIRGEIGPFEPVGIAALRDRLAVLRDARGDERIVVRAWRG